MAGIAQFIGGDIEQAGPAAAAGGDIGAGESFSHLLTACGGDAEFGGEFFLGHILLRRSSAMRLPRV